MTKKSQETKARILKTARKLFARQGVNNTSLRAITAEADVNLAAINYHFGGKDALYTSVLEYIFSFDFSEAFPQEFQLAESDDPEVQLKAYIKRTLYEIYMMDGSEHPASDAWTIFLMEMAHPSDNLDFLVRDHIQDRAESLRKILRDILGSEIDRRIVIDCAMSIWSQILDPLVMMPITDRMNPPRPRVQDNLEGFAEHIYLFTMGGLKAIREHHAQ